MKAFDTLLEEWVNPTDYVTGYEERFHPFG